MEIYYKLNNLSIHSEQKQGIMSNNIIIEENLYIPYFYHQGSYSDSDVYFTVELFYNNIKIFESDIEFKLFDDSVMDNYVLMNKKTFVWKPFYVNEKYFLESDRYFEHIGIKNVFILDKKLTIEFDFDFDSDM